MIRDGKVGQVQEISSCFGFNIAPGEWRLNKMLAGGGPLYDVGIYSLNATRYLTGEEPAKLTAVMSTIDHDGRFNEVEENMAWTTLFPSGIVASCSTSYGANTGGYFKVYGSKGWLALDPGSTTTGCTCTTWWRASDRRAQSLARPIPVHGSSGPLLALRPEQSRPNTRARRAEGHALDCGNLPGCAHGRLTRSTLRGLTTAIEL